MAMTIHRAYSLLTVKRVADEDQRLIEGMATTPSPDRMGDVIEPTGAKFSNPLPLLWQHMMAAPVGRAIFAKPTKDGIAFKARIEKLDEPGTLKDRTDEAWQSVKRGLVRAVSIGFRSLEHSRMEDGGIRFLKTEIMELSLVTIPANAEATISVVKALDRKRRRPGAALPAKPSRAKHWLFPRGDTIAFRGRLYKALRNTDILPTDGLPDTWKRVGAAQRKRFLAGTELINRRLAHWPHVRAVRDTDAEPGIGPDWLLLAHTA
jgi:uncharacterized protein